MERVSNIFCPRIAWAPGCMDWRVTLPAPCTSTLSPRLSSSLIADRMSNPVTSGTLLAGNSFEGAIFLTGCPSVEAILSVSLLVVAAMVGRSDETDFLSLGVSASIPRACIFRAICFITCPDVRFALRPAAPCTSTMQLYLGSS